MAETNPGTYPDTNSTVFNPNIPYWGVIPGKLQIGKMIEIRGTVPYGADVFQINFTSGRDEKEYADRLLHISIRFSQRIVVRNSLVNDEWGTEEKDGGFPFASGKQFLMMVLVEQNCYRIAVNGQHYWEFAHRLAFTNASMLNISGSVKINEIRYIDPTSQLVGTCIQPSSKISVVPPIFNPNSSVGTCVQPTNESKGLPPVFNPIIPYSYPIYGGLSPGMMIYISGRPSASVYKFSINLQCSTCPYPPPDIAFHVDARVYNSTIIRNTRVNNHWGREEAISPFFPFRPGVNFDMIIKVENDKFLIALNGQHFIEYKHRIFPLSTITVLNIENDVVVSSIRFAS